ncbi:MAG TPA: DUF4386 domain-containing protein [Devosia sp.]|jgi:hypothetical protein|nr:DUF4386 domain-containing protein [Devosia sp.]
MTTITTTAPAVDPFHRTNGAASVRKASDAERPMDSQLLGRLTGLFFLITYATSIPPVLTLYVPALSNPAFVLGGPFNEGVTWGVVLELLLIVANIASALTLYPMLKRRFPVLSLGFVAARVMESAFIAMGIISVLALVTLRATAGDADPAALSAVGQALVAIHDWTFKMGPGVVVGVGNGLILGYMMWKTRLLPRFISVLGLIGGPALLLAACGVMFGHFEVGSTVHGLFVAPEFLWELLLGIWLLVRGFSPAALTALDAHEA